MTDEKMRAAVVEERARKICAELKADPDTILDPYGPVRQWDVVAAHIDGAVEALASAPVNQDEVGHVAAILEEWDMKSPPNDWTGHDYRDIATDILRRTRSNEDSGRGEDIPELTDEQWEAIKALAPKPGTLTPISEPGWALPTDQPATGDGAEDVVERLMDEAYQSADCPAGGPYALSWEQAKYMVRAALTSTAVVPGMVPDELRALADEVQREAFNPDARMAARAWIDFCEASGKYVQKLLSAVPRAGGIAND